MYETSCDHIILGLDTSYVYTVYPCMPSLGGKL